MGYKVFFAFQMDIEDKYGKGFIQSAVEIAIQKFKNQNIDISLDFGFRGTPGTPLLIEEMLKKSSEADMVIVDLTFTSSKAWFDTKKIKFFGKEVKINGKDLLLFDIKKDKKSPNPNVLLETGYAWAKKGTYRTLVVMNEAYGIPSELPVDFDGFRWGITFNISALNYADRSNIRKQLAEDFYIAIKASINSEMSYQTEKWRPFDIHSEWDKRHPYPYKLTTRLKTKLLEVRDKIINYKNPIRIIGQKDVGKTRFVLELLKSNDDIIEHELKNSILYFDLFNTSYSAILNQIHELKRLKQIKIVVLDNCDETTHETLANLFELTDIRLITIDTLSSSFEKLSNHIYLDEKIALDVNKEIIKDRFSSGDISFITEKIGSSSKKLITILGKDTDGYVPAKSFIENYFSQFGLNEKAIDDYIKLLSIISVFGIVGITGNFKKEIEEIQKNILMNSISVDQIDSIIINLIDNMILIKKGDFIYIDVFVEEFIELWWNQNKGSLEDLIINISKLDLFDKFVNQLSTIIGYDENKWIKDLIFESEKLLNNPEFLSTKAADLLLNKLVESYPEEVLKVMFNKIQ